MKRLRFAVLLAGGLAVLVLGAEPGRRPITPGILSDSPVKIAERVLWTAGEGGVASYRIPALATAPNGDLIAVCDARVTNSQDLLYGGQIHPVIRRSTDGGKTWTASEKVWDWPRNEKEEWSVGEPALVVDQVAKKVFLLTYGNDWKKISPGHDWKKWIGRTFVQESADNGRTWSAPRDISGDMSFPEWPFGKTVEEKGEIFVTSGSGFQTKDGTLLVVMNRVGDGWTGDEVCLLGSSDHGRTWRPFGKPAKPGDESKVVELPDGTLMVNSRMNAGGRWVHLSRDCGMTWESKPMSALLDAECNAQLMKWGDRLLFSNCNSKKRENICVRTSRDWGKTWNEGVVVWPGVGAYSDITELLNGDIGILYERGDQTGNYKAIVFDVISRERLL